MRCIIHTGRIEILRNRGLAANRRLFPAFLDREDINRLGMAGAVKSWDCLDSSFIPVPYVRLSGLTLFGAGLQTPPECPTEGLQY